MSPFLTAHLLLRIGTENDIKALSDKVSHAEIPITQRRELLELLNQKKVAMLENEKKKLSNLLASLTEDAVAAEKNQQLLQVVTVETNVTSAPKVVKGLCKKAKKTSFVVVVKSDTGVSVALSIQKTHADKVDGVALFEKLKELCSFKGGGKPTSLAGTTSEAGKYNDIVAQVETFVQTVNL